MHAKYRLYGAWGAQPHQRMSKASSVRRFGSNPGVRREAERRIQTHEIECEAPSAIDGAEAWQGASGRLCFNAVGHLGGTIDSNRPVKKR